jgi:hypothetical protein
LVSALETYNAGPSAVRLSGTFAAGGRGTVDFGATVVEREGLRFDALAGPFSTLVVALACRTGISCLAFVPSRSKAYVDDAGRWDGLLGPALRGRVPRLDGSTVAGAWAADSGRPTLLLQGRGGWQERIEFSRNGRLPEVVFLGPPGESPDARIDYDEFGEAVGGQPFPRRVTVWLRDSGKTYAIRIRRVEAIGPEVDPSLFVLSLPPNTRLENLRGRATWEETGIPIWPPLQKGPMGPP